MFFLTAFGLNVFMTSTKLYKFFEKSLYSVHRNFTIAGYPRLEIRQEKHIKWSQHRGIGNCTRNSHRNASVILQVTESRHIVSKRTASPLKKKKSCRVDKEIRQRNWKSSDGKLLMPSLWEIASRQKRSNLKRRIKDWNKSFDAHVVVQPQSTMGPGLQERRLLTPNKFWNELVT